MTQFLVLTGAKPEIEKFDSGVWVISIEEACSSVQKTVHKILTPEQIQRSWMLRGGDTGEPADWMCGHIGFEMVIEEKTFEQTVLGQFLLNYMSNPEWEQLTFFYAVEEKPLKKIEKCMDFFIYLQEQTEYDVVYQKESN